MSAQLLELPKATLADVPRVLRSIADQIEAGEYGEAISALLVLETNSDAHIHLFGAGAADHMRSFMLIAKAQQALMRL